MNEMLDFLKALRLMINEEDSEYAAPWTQVPDEYKEDFESWCGEVKQQTWTGNEARGWHLYHLEYLSYLVGTKIGELE